MPLPTHLEPFGAQTRRSSHGPGGGLRLSPTSQLGGISSSPCLTALGPSCLPR